MNNIEEKSTQLVQLCGEKEGAISPSIVQSAAFAYGSSTNAQDIFNGSLQKPLYSRMGNPTNSHLEDILTQLNDGVAAIATSSGMAAISMAVMSHVESGDEIISIGGLFGGTYSFFSETLTRFGIETHFFDVDDLEGIISAINDNTKIIYIESVGNPSMSLADIPSILKIANDNNIISIVDNTLTPLSLMPIKLGADMVVYSTTKIITGNASALGGAVVFKDALKNESKLLCGKYPFYEKFIKKAGPKAMYAVAKKRALRDFGMSASAFSSYLTILGIDTLAIRIQRIDESIRKIVKLLDENGMVVNHPSLSNHKHHNRYNNIFNQSTGSLFTVDLGSKEKAFKFLDNLQLATITANVSDNRTLALHMASTIYSDFNDKEKEFLGITDGLVRVSVGLENPEDIVDDFLSSLKK